MSRSRSAVGPAVALLLVFAADAAHARQSPLSNPSFEFSEDWPTWEIHPAGDEVAVKARSKDLLPVEVSLEARTRPALLEWLALDEKARVGRMVRQPARSDIPLAVQEQLIVELYSK